MCFLEREVYAFCGERVRGAMLRARIFCLWRAAEDDVRGRRWIGRRWIGVMRANCCGQSNTGEMTCERCAEKGKTNVFLFLGGKTESSCSVFRVAVAGAQLLRPWGMGSAANVAGAVAARRGKTQLVEG